ncbi:MAG: hypothetical protein ACOYEV_18910 [Candidatus Nanopelagicales bacterium]
MSLRFLVVACYVTVTLGAVFALDVLRRHRPGAALRLVGAAILIYAVLIVVLW